MPEGEHFTPEQLAKEDAEDRRDRVAASAKSRLKLATILSDIEAEFQQAQLSNAPMTSLHHGLSILEEEVFELRMEVYKNPRKHPDRNELARKEAIQVAAMALRLLHDVL